MKRLSQLSISKKIDIMVDAGVMTKSQAERAKAKLEELEVHAEAAPV